MTNSDFFDDRDAIASKAEAPRAQTGEAQPLPNIPHAV